VVKTIFVIIGAALLSWLAMVVAIILGVGDLEPMSVALRTTARVSFIFFLGAFVAAPLVQVTRSAFGRWLRANRRHLGIAFVAAHTVHMGMVAKYLDANPGALPLPFLAGAIVLVVILYAMFATSFDVTARAIGPRAWKILHTTGIYLFAGVFSLAFIGGSVSAAAPRWFYLPFGVAMALAWLVRIAAWMRRRRPASA